GTSYIELAEFLQTHGAKDHIENDLEQLYRRVAFNVAVGNRDDHLRNHGFLLTAAGWRLAPAFDLNPNIARTFKASSRVPNGMGSLRIMAQRLWRKCSELPAPGGNTRSSAALR